MTPRLWCHVAVVMVLLLVVCWGWRPAFCCGCCYG